MKVQIEAVSELSYFIARSMQAMGMQISDLATLVEMPMTRENFEAALSSIDDVDALDLAMRVLRRKVMLATAAGDLIGKISYDTVVQRMSDLAEVCVDQALRVHCHRLAQRFGVPVSSQGVVQDLMVVGMGKLGGHELNASSDIDLVFVYDESGETKPLPPYENARRTITNHEFFDKLAKGVIASIDALEGPGFVFRVDTRLRPFGDSGPLVVSMAMLEDYLFREGREWERFAWLKGRVINQAHLGSTENFKKSLALLDSLVRPFVFRKYVDFSAIRSLARVHEMIRAQTARKEIGHEQDINVKLGRGGIREIEFICQTFQIIRGGREPELRGKSTLKMLPALVEAGSLTQDVADRLAQDYVFLRNVEHALQYVDDKQTQVLVNKPEEHVRIAKMVGMTPEALIERLMEIRQFVGSTFDGIFHLQVEAKDDDWPIGWRVGDAVVQDELAQKLMDQGLQNPTAVQDLAGHILKMMRSRLIPVRTPDARDQLAHFIQKLPQAVISWSELNGSQVPAETLMQRYLNLLEVILGRPTYVALLNQYPKAADRVGRLLSLSRWAADYITEHPLVLDELVDARNSDWDETTPIDANIWREQTAQALKQHENDTEAQMNILRDAHHSRLFRFLMADVEGKFSTERLADHLSAQADAVLSLVMELAWASIKTRHREIPKFAVIGYGKLGGKELAYASDLDLIFLYDDDHPEAEAQYIKLVRRMMSWLTMQTSSGILFSVDLRLRPNGQNGLVVTSYSSFESYQRNTDGHGAWMWEHQALTRARCCAGDCSIAERFEALRNEILQMSRDSEALTQGVIEMRGKMLAGHPNDQPTFDVKHDRGGMVDIEFLVQFLILRHAHDYPSLTENLGTTALLGRSAELGLVDESLARAGISAYRQYRQIQREVRLILGDEGRVRVPFERVGDAPVMVQRLWYSVMGTDQPQP